MITHIEIEGFKSFEKVSLDLGGLNIFVGTNASGKSNFFDALRVLQGIGYGFTIEEIFNGKPRSSTSDAWPTIRGGRSNASFLRWKTGTSGAVRGVVRLKVTLSVPIPERPLTYAISISTDRGLVRWEQLSYGDQAIFETDEWDEHFPDSPTIALCDYPGRAGQTRLHFHRSRPVLRQLWEHPSCDETHRPLLESFCHLLSDMQLLDPSPSVLQAYSQASVSPRMGEHGENFAGLVASIVGDDQRADQYMSWLEELTPAEFDTVGTLRGALGEPLFAVEKNRHWIPAPMLSDGTLRFAALAAAFFQPDMPETLLIEEVENGLHPTRLRLLVELLRSQSANGRPQVMATSHSPLVLAWLNENDYKTTFLCQKDEETGASTITPLSSIPRFIELAREQSAADLFAEGWLETAL